MEKNNEVMIAEYFSKGPSEFNAVELGRAALHLKRIRSQIIITPHLTNKRQTVTLLLSSRKYKLLRERELEWIVAAVRVEVVVEAIAAVTAVAAQAEAASVKVGCKCLLVS